ncbi:hypothetical protein KIN20_022423 [Parelaphostrongylus tenuis]|uniref:Beta-1,4-N-acetylgalactosaminyltransferase n=1 Tax=Parelaphostrongylus tenuis TaxID=148309 RepID=A0AAD5QUS1_PARTN|nr:hypothetical protein KIN20_022423 [Parelaphostrongylus tenuis]
MTVVTRNKIKLLLVLVMVAGILHLVVDKGQSFYENFDRVNTYLEADPFTLVLENTVVHHNNESYSTAPNLLNDSSIVRVTVDHELLLNGSGIDDGQLLNTSYPFSSQPSTLELCPLVPPRLVGPIRVWMDSPTFSALQKLYPHLEAGGHGKPKDCRSRHRVAIVVPYRDRESHLRTLLHNLHSLLMKQQLDYTIIVVEQVANQTFNRAKLMNVGFAEGIKLYMWECFIFHDVDLLPEDDRNLYSCPTIPRHMSVAIDKFNYKLPYTAIFGGISAMTVGQLQSINGFSNRYWGWGGEDDDLADRCESRSGNHHSS